MPIDILNQEAFYKEFDSYSTVYNKVTFNELNAWKVEHVYYLRIKVNSHKFGIILGLENFELFNPFSSPFGELISSNWNFSLLTLDLAIKELCHWLKINNFSSLKIILPPPFYISNYSEIINVLFSNGFFVENIDLNYHFNLTKFSDNYNKLITRNARKNLANSLTKKLIFENVLNNSLEDVYNVIYYNRLNKGYPLRMSLEQLTETIKIIECDLFVVRINHKIIASAIVFKVNSECVQVIYWGDDRSAVEYRCMNFLSFKIFEFYKSKKIKYVDLGPSTEYSIPNFGLCDFKSSIGCDTSLKFSLKKNNIEHINYK